MSIRRRSRPRRALAFSLLLSVGLTLAGCGKEGPSASAPALRPIDSVLLQAPRASSAPDVQLEQQTRQEQTARHGENSRTGGPRPQRHGAQPTP
ncbi:MAG: hypothetical protein VKQ33_03605 [Candidatus Sericytochromatia bacterium]|nr:hypothetical protein [Candidatus Sericytochromatia bacterium]